MEFEGRRAFDTHKAQHLLVELHRSAHRPDHEGDMVQRYQWHLAHHAHLLLDNLQTHLQPSFLLKTRFLISDFSLKLSLSSGSIYSTKKEDPSQAPQTHCTAQYSNRKKLDAFIEGGKKHAMMLTFKTCTYLLVHI